MKHLNVVALVLVLVGAVNWGLVGIFNLNLVSTIFGLDTVLTNLIYILVGVSGVYCWFLLKPLSAHERYPTTPRFRGPGAG